MKKEDKQAELDRLLKEEELYQLQQQELTDQETQKRQVLEKTAPVIGETGQALESKNIQPAKDFGVVEAAKDVATVFPMGASYNFADEIKNKLSPGSGDVYLEKVKAARERSPVATMASELAGQALTTGVVSEALAPVLPFMAEGTLAREAISGGVSALGGSEAKDTAGKVIDTAIGTGLSLGATIVGRALKAPFKEPGLARAKALGATKKEFRFLGKMKDPSKIFSELKDDGFMLRDSNVKFNPNTLKFSRTYGASTGPKIDRTNPLAGFAERASEAANIVTQEIRNTLQVSNVPAKAADFITSPKLAEDINASINSSIYPSKMKAMWDEEITNLMGILDRKNMTLSDLNDIKHNYQVAATKIYDNPNSAEDMVQRADIHADIARNLKEFIQEELTARSPELGRRLEKLNDAGFKLHFAKGVLREGAASNAARGWTSNVPLLPQIQQLFGAGLSQMKESPESIMMRSAIGEKGVKIPFRPQIEDMIKQYPGKEYNRAEYENPNQNTMALPKAIDTTVNFLLPPDRAPQSLVEQIVRKPFPRTSQEIVQHRDFVLSKLAQQAPEFFDPVRDIIDYEPEKIPEIMPLISQAAPHLFAHDKFNRWDGKIIDPKLKEAARKEIMINDKISNTQKALLMDRLNKTGEY